MRLADVTLPASGAYVELNDLIALRFPAKQIQLTRRKRALQTLAGPNKSNFRGRGIDFDLLGHVCDHTRTFGLGPQTK